ncbi:hypothetical protein HC928_00430 [bacterium]|nr:hypothetical protein [bacterium]
MPTGSQTLAQRYNERILEAATFTADVQEASAAEEQQQTPAPDGSGSSLSNVETNPQGALGDFVVPPGGSGNIG